MLLFSRMVHFLFPNLNLLLRGSFENSRHFTSISKHLPVHQRLNGVAKNIVSDQVHELKNSHLHLHLHHLQHRPLLKQFHRHRRHRYRLYNRHCHQIQHCRWLDLTFYLHHLRLNKHLSLFEFVFLSFLSFSHYILFDLLFFFFVDVVVFLRLFLNDVLVTICSCHCNL